MNKKIEEKFIKSLPEAIWVWGQALTAAKSYCCKVFLRPQAVLGLLLGYSVCSGWWWRSLGKASLQPYSQLDAHLHALQRVRVLLWSVTRGAVTVGTAVSSSSRVTGDSNSLVLCRWAGCVTSSRLRCEPEQRCRLPARAWGAERGPPKSPPPCRGGRGDASWWGLSAWPLRGPRWTYS